MTPERFDRLFFGALTLALLLVLLGIVAYGLSHPHPNHQEVRSHGHP